MRQLWFYQALFRQITQLLVLRFNLTKTFEANKKTANSVINNNNNKKKQMKENSRRRNLHGFTEGVSVWVFAIITSIQALNGKQLEQLCVQMWFSFSLTNISLIK